MSRRVEIRCCCDPGLLLGTVEVPGFSLSEGDRFVFFIRPAVSLLPYEEQRDGCLFKTDLGKRLTLTVERVQGLDKSGRYLDGLALKSNDTPIDELRRISGFQEAR